jgi:hypothetical protein
MPLVHIVLVRVPPGVDSSEFVETANEFFASISAIVSYKVGHATNGPAKNRGFNFAMVIELEDEDVCFDLLLIRLHSEFFTQGSGPAPLGNETSRS